MDEEERNYCCLLVLLLRVGVVKLRQYFVDQWNTVGGFVAWTDCPQNGTDLLSKFKPLAYEKDNVKCGDTSKWDLSLFVKALVNSKPPLVSRKCLVSAMKCLKDTRNKLCHTPSGKIETAEFNKLWSAACNALVLVGVTSKDFKKVKHDVKLQPWSELVSLTKQCASNDKDILHVLDAIIKGQKEIKQGQEQLRDEVLQGQSGLQQGQEEIQQGQEQLREEVLQGQSGLQQRQEEIQQGQEVIQQGQEEIQQGQEKLLQGQEKILRTLNVPSPSLVCSSKLSVEDVRLCSKNLKVSSKRRTEFQPKFMASHSVSSARTDDIFTNLMIQRGRKPLPTGGDTERWEQLVEYSRLTGIPIKRCQDIFIAPEKDKPNPKSILVTGKPGIGKSLFCQKLLRDWADDVLFQDEPSANTNDFDFVYLLTFRELNLLGDQELNLREVLNRCSLLDEHSSMDESLFEYIIEHPEKVMFIIDGYDEYAHPENISLPSFEKKYDNNPRIGMPVAALFSKLLRKNVFANSVVMVTSRPNKAEMLGGIDFGAVVEIAGFSPEQIKEFIEKYFQSKPEKMKNDVVDHIMKNENLLSTAHIPMLCFLMCWCLEWHNESNTAQDLPVTITDLYSEVVNMFVLKHHSQSTYRADQLPEQFEVPSVVENTLEKLSQLAAETLKQKKLIFEEADLKKFKLAPEETESLKASGLLTCGPGFRETPFKIKRSFGFSHLTFHEYFAASWFVKRNEIPSLEVVESHMVFQFMAGLSAREKHEELMEQLMESIPKHPVLLPAKCLYEYRDREFAVKIIQKYHRCFCTDEGILQCGNHVLSEVDCVAVSLFLIAINEFCKDKAQEHEAQSSQQFIINGLCLDCLIATLPGAERIYDSLKHNSCPITYLEFPGVDDKCLQYLSRALPSTKITTLKLAFSNITDEGLQYLSNVLASTNITTLDLGNTKITNEGLKCLVYNLRLTNIASLHLQSCNIDRMGIKYLSMEIPGNKLATLNISKCNIGDEGLIDLTTVLPGSNIIALDLSSTNISGRGLLHLSIALPSTNITTLNLSNNSLYYTCTGSIPVLTVGTYNCYGHGDGMQLLFDTLPLTKISTLELRNSVIRDRELQQLSKVLPSTNITILDLSYNEHITGKGLECVGEVLPSTNVVELYIGGLYLNSANYYRYTNNDEKCFLEMMAIRKPSLHVHICE